MIELDMSFDPTPGRGHGPAPEDDDIPTLVRGEPLAAERPDPASMLGEALGDRYQLTKILGRGGMGCVYDALDRRLDRRVAVKLVLDAGFDQQARDRFLVEARAAASLNHPNVVSVYDAGEENGHAFIVMEVVPGDSLAVRPPGNFDEIVQIAIEICGALDHAHSKGIVHRDLKPGNVLRTGAQDGSPRIKLADLGIALTRGRAKITRTGVITGTPAFMSPEQALGQKIDGRSDLYSLGVMLYLWTCGRLPFEGDDVLAIVSQHLYAPIVPPQSFRADIPVELESIVLRLLEKIPEKRFASAHELRSALSDLDISQPSVSSRTGSIELLTRGRLVAREEQLSTLQSLWRGVGQTGTPIALISGEPGIGKTRLAREIIAAARLDGARVLDGGCYENEATTPYLPFLEAFRKLTRELSDELLRTTLEDSAAYIARLAPEIESRLGPFARDAILDASEERLRLFDHVARFLARLSKSRGLLFFIDDLQWADRGTLDLLHYLLRQLRDERTLFVGTHRRAELDSSTALSAALVDWNREKLAAEIRLDRLDRDASARMIGTMLGGGAPPEPLVDALYRETEGNPFFLEEIVKTLVTAGVIVHSDSRWVGNISDEFLLPPSVKAAIGTRLSRVSSRTRNALSTAAVLGKTFRFDELLGVSSNDENEILDALDEAVAAQLLAFDGGESFAFTHDKIREVLHDELNPIRRRRLHERIAETQERRASKSDQTPIEEIAYHFVQAGNYERGLVWSERAAAAAAEVFAWDEQIEMLRQASDCAEALGRTDAARRLDEETGDSLEASGQLEEAAEVWERLLEREADRETRIRLHCKTAEAWVTLGDPAGLYHVEQALDLIDSEQERLELAAIRGIRARYSHLAGDYQKALAEFGPAVELAEQSHDPQLLIRVLANLAGTYQHLARFSESEGVASRALEVARAHGVPMGEMFGHEFISESHFYRGNWDECIRHGAIEEELARERHAVERFLWSHFRALAHLVKGEATEAEILLKRAISESRRIGERRLRLFLEPGLATLYALRGEPDRAVRECRTTTEEATELELTSNQLNALGSLVTLLVTAGRFSEALEQARIGCRLWEEGRSIGLGLILGADLAEGLLLGGAPDAEVTVALDRHEALAVRTDSPSRLGQNHYVRGLLARRRGEANLALEWFGKALERYDKTGSALFALKLLQHRAELLDASGRKEEAAADAERAETIRSLFLVTSSTTDG